MIWYNTNIKKNKKDNYENKIRVKYIKLLKYDIS